MEENVVVNHAGSVLMPEKLAMPIIPAKEESPQDQEKKKNLRVAAYCRVSTKKDEQLGSYGGTFAQKDIAFEFASWISAEFKLYIIKDYQRLKNDENSRLALGWNLNRTLAKINYRIHTDAIKDVLIPPDVTPQRQSFTYANEADVLNVALFGITSKEWRQTHQDSKGNIRDEASLQQLIVLANLESINAELIRQGVPQSERLLRLNASAKQMMQSLVGDHRIDEFRTYGELPNKESK